MKNKSLITTANDFVNELTSHTVIEKSLIDKKQICKEYKNNSKAVQSVLLQRVTKS
jgi:hypothetical protein